jgi:3' terminal RNA ribose 2'-O-methyltransferase Hen1
VLDDDKHYWVGEAEVEKLLRRGEGWLGSHPERQLIVDRYLVRQRPLTKAALTQLAEDDPDPDESEERYDSEEAAVEAPMSLNEQRLGSVFAALKASDAQSVVDLGCGEGRLLQRLLDDGDFKRIVGIDVSHRALEIAARRLRLDRMPERKRARVELLQGSLVYRDSRLAGFDAAALVEVIEHLEPERLAALEANVFGTARPQTVVVTTPNVEYNATFETLPAGRFRHRDHRFEWTRDQFRGWAGAVAQRHDYSVRYVPIGPEDPEVGPPTQMAVFSQ